MRISGVSTNSAAVGGSALRARVVAACLLTLALGPGAAAGRAEVDFGSFGARGGQFVEPNGIAIDQETGDVYVMDTTNERVEKFTSRGTFLLAWGWGVANNRVPALQTCSTAASCHAGLDGTGAGEFRFAEGLAVDNDPASPSHHDVYAVDVDSYRVEKFSPTGRFLLMFGGGVNASARERGESSGEDICPIRPGDVCTAGQEGSGDGQFDFRDEGNFVAVGADGTVFVGDHNRVQEFNPNGSYRSQFALVPAVPGGGEAGGTLALAVDASGDVYALRFGLGGVQKYTPQGQLVQTLDEEAPPEDAETTTPSMTLDPEGYLFLDYHLANVHRMLEYAPSGVLVASFDVGPSEGPDGLDGLHGLAYADRLGRLYVVNANAPTARVRIVDPPPPTDEVFSGFDILPRLFGQ